MGVGVSSTALRRAARLRLHRPPGRPILLSNGLTPHHHHHHHRFSASVTHVTRGSPEEHHGGACDGRAIRSGVPDQRHVPVLHPVPVRAGLIHLPHAALADLGGDCCDTGRAWCRVATSSWLWGRHHVPSAPRTTLTDNADVRTAVRNTGRTGSIKRRSLLLARQASVS